MTKPKGTPKRVAGLNHADARAFDGIDKVRPEGLIVQDVSEMTDAGVVLLMARLLDGKISLHGSQYPLFAERLDAIGRSLVPK